MRISDWSSDVCSSDLTMRPDNARTPAARATAAQPVSAQWSVYWATGADSRHHSEARLFAAVGILTQYCALHDRGTKALDTGRQIKRSEARRGGKEGVRPCRYRWWPYN